jgi:hypothetical protein
MDCILHVVLMSVSMGMHVRRASAQDQGHVTVRADGQPRPDGQVGQRSTGGHRPAPNDCWR